MVLNFPSIAQSPALGNQGATKSWPSQLSHFIFHNGDSGQLLS